MVGGLNKRDDGLPAISSTNIFSALERRKKSSKKRSDKEKGEYKTKEVHQPEFIAPQTWTPAPVSVTSWADCEEDDDDYFPLPALPPIADQQVEPADAFREDLSQESEEDEELEEADEENDDEEPETEEVVEVVTVKAQAAALVAREPDRQLSKKELKKKELADLDMVLAEFGLNPQDGKEADKAKGFAEAETKEDHSNHANGDFGQSEDLGNGTAQESKSSKRRKAKKEKPMKEGREDEGPQESDVVPKQEVGEEDEGAGTGAVDRKVLKKIASMKKKKSFKENDGAAKVAAAEAAARAAKLAAAKKKEKSHYNQQPVR